MNRQERERIIASLTDGDLEQLRSRGAGDADPQEPNREFLRALKTEHDRDRIAEVAERFSAPSRPTIGHGNHVPREGGNLTRPEVTERQRLVDFVRTITDPSHEPEI